MPFNNNITCFSTNTNNTSRLTYKSEFVVVKLSLTTFLHHFVYYNNCIIICFMQFICKSAFLIFTPFSTKFENQLQKLTCRGRFCFWSCKCETPDKTLKVTYHLMYFMNNVFLQYFLTVFLQYCTSTVTY